MKIKVGDFAKLSAYIDSAIEKTGLNFQQYLIDSAHQTDTRRAWDLWWLAGNIDKSAGPWLCDTLYSYLNDEHITTALKKYVTIRSN